MNETEKERILRMLSEGNLRPAEAATLLAALADEPETDRRAGKSGQEESGERPKQAVEVTMQRPDGSTYRIELPPNLVPMLWKMARVAIKESARNATREAWDGFKIMVRNKADDVRSNVQTRFTGERPPAIAAPEEDERFEARRSILQMVQNGRITASEASRLIQELDALKSYRETHLSVATGPGTPR